MILKYIFDFVILGYELLLMVKGSVQSLEFILVNLVWSSFEDIKCGVGDKIYADGRFCLYYVKWSE